MRKIVAGFALVLALAGCTTAQVATSRVDTTALAKGAYDARAMYAAALVLATEYVEWPRCDQPLAPKLCSSPGVVVEMVRLRKTAAAATKAAENAVRSAGDNPMVATAAVKAAQQAASAFKVISETYNPGSAP